MDNAEASAGLRKAPTGISGLDDVTQGGLPVGRPTLICGAAGCGKTMFAATFLANGATMFNEPGVFVSFEERARDLSENVASLGYDFDRLVAEGLLAIDHVHVERGEIEESGEYDLEGLFVRLAYAVDSVGAKRVVLDTIETLFSGLSDTAVLRSELRRLFGWLKDRGLTAVITGERGEGQLTRQGLEEYVSDCVILLDNRVQEQVTTRRLRIVKYRGSAHGTNEYPFLIDHDGITVLPVTAAGLSHAVSSDVLSSGIPGLDAMLGAGGFYRGSSVLLSGVAGTGKTTMSMLFVDAACRRGERCMVFVFEESPAQLVRNARSIGLDLQVHVDAGLLRFEAARPSLYGLEMHLAAMHRDIERFRPDLVVVDPISALRGPASEVHATLLRMIDLLKRRCILGVFTTLKLAEDAGSADFGVSSLMDSWVKLDQIEANGERNRALYVMKSRGMSHSNQVREYIIGSNGIDLIEPFIGPDGVLTGTARANEVARRAAAALRSQLDTDRRARILARKNQVLDREIAERRAALAIEAEEFESEVAEETARSAQRALDQDDLLSRRNAAR